MLAFLAILGAVGAGVLADTLLNSGQSSAEDLSGDEDADGSEESGAGPTMADSPAPMLDWIFADGGTDTVGSQGGFVDDGMPVSDDSPDSTDHAVSLTGDDSDDILSGGAADDRLTGGHGNDQLTGRDGDDLLSGGSGHDYLDSGSGDDSLHGQGGHDTLVGGAGNDALFGGMGRDSLAGGEGDDMLKGGSGADTLMGGEGQDSLDGGMGRDWLAGGAGDDLMVGGASQDTLDGGSGDDTLWGGFEGQSDAAVDMLNGGAGADLMILGPGDIATGGDGADTFQLQDFRDGSPLAEIVDYDPDQDDIVVLYDANQHSAPELTTEPIEDSEDITLLLDGVAVALIRNAGAFDLSQITLRAA